MEMRNLHDLIIRDQYDGGGRCDDTKGIVIKNLIIETNAQLCVEIGVLKGASLMYFAEALEITKGKVIGIDPYSMETLYNEIPDKEIQKYTYEVLFNEQIVLDNLYNGLSKVISENNLENTISLVRSKSEDYYTNIEKESIDILHIDGNHDEEFVTKDIQFYLPLVKKGGYIIMDDTTWPGVINSINNHLNNQTVLINSYNEYSVHKKI
jgi:predicted O-methyltransferase YrrM